MELCASAAATKHEPVDFPISDCYQNRRRAEITWCAVPVRVFPRVTTSSPHKSGREAGVL